MCRRMLLAGVLLVLSAGVGLGGASRSALSVPRSNAIRALLIQPYQGPVTILSIAGKRLSVPARVQASPLGLSPDARLIVEVTADAVRVGLVRGGSMRTVLRENFYLADPSFAWSPDSQRLAAAANRREGPTSLRIMNRTGRTIHSYTLPRTNPETGERAYYHLISWSPNGSQLLLRRSNRYGPVAIVVLDLRTGRLRRLALRRVAHFTGCDHPQPTWSPDGRYVALPSRATQDCFDHFAIFDAASARPILQRTWVSGSGEGRTGTVWASDSRSVYAARSSFSKAGQIFTGIDRIDLSGRRTTIVGSSAGVLIPWVSLPAGLVYQANSPAGKNLLYLNHSATGRRELLLRRPVHWSIQAVLPLAHTP